MSHQYSQINPRWPLAILIVGLLLAVALGVGVALIGLEATNH